MSNSRYSHAYTIAFEIESGRKSGSDVTAEMIRAAIIKRIENLPDDELVNEAVGSPYDSSGLDGEDEDEDEVLCECGREAHLCTYRDNPKGGHHDA
jgi:hypothetical protein